jgi:hypothetical protein
MLTTTLNALFMGRTEEGLDHARRSVALDPLSVEFASLLGWELYFARRYDEAVVELRKCIHSGSIWDRSSGRISRE